MEPLKEANDRALDAAEGHSQEAPSAGRRPARYRLYDRIADRVSVNAMNIIIVATVVLLVAAIVVGVVTASPQ